MSRTDRHSPRGRGWAAVLLTAALALSGCAAGQISQTAQQVSGVDGSEGTAGYIGVRNVLLATPEGSNYPTGSDIPLLLWISNDSQAGDTLTGASSPAAASVEITGNAAIPAQSLVQVAPQQKIAMTVKGLAKDLNYGFSIPVTFTFASAGAITVNVPVEIPTSRTVTDRPRINIQPVEPHDMWVPAEQSSPPAPQHTTVAPSSAPGTTASGG